MPECLTSGLTIGYTGECPPFFAHDSLFAHDSQTGCRLGPRTHNRWFVQVHDMWSLARFLNSKTPAYDQLFRRLGEPSRDRGSIQSCAFRGSLRNPNDESEAEITQRPQREALGCISHLPAIFKPPILYFHLSSRSQAIIKTQIRIECIIMTC